MREVIEELNEMSFELPAGWQKTTDLYEVGDEMGFINIANYVSDRGEVFSLFMVERDPEEFLNFYMRHLAKLENVSKRFSHKASCNLRSGDFVFPTHVIAGLEGGLYMFQFFCNCGDRLAVFMANVPTFNEDIKNTISQNRVLKQIIKILKTIE